ncbi:hypothetical protein [Longimicrobium sp.]|uniref:hypothetical protein n=1 Tax=Longimicrobium sp. TaxID=2029185 RepID=UPI002E316244|nr:hypothetical protein [Longimicrobium sp.]HEX6038881.1 hypothetical protein [Longimicrobium sp.]
MADGKWRTVPELAVLAGCTEAGASARLRDLRKPKFGRFTVERRPIAPVWTPRLYEYRVILRG